MAKLNDNQNDVLECLRQFPHNAKTGSTAKELGVSGSTMASLAKKGFVESGADGTYLITKAGRMAYREANGLRLR